MFNQTLHRYICQHFKETKSATMIIFRFVFLFKSIVKVELSYIFTINLFTIAENCTEKKNYLIKTGIFSLVGNYLRPSKIFRKLIFNINAVVLILIIC